MLVLRKQCEISTVSQNETLEGACLTPSKIGLSIGFQTLRCLLGKCFIQEKNGVSCAMCDLRMMGAMPSGTFSDEEYEEHSVRNFPSKVFGKVGQGAVYLFLEDGEACAGGTELPFGISLFVARNARRLVVVALLPLLLTVSHCCSVF